MKKVLTLTLTLAVIALTCHAQTPQKMSYQAVIRDAQGNLVTNQPVGIHFSIHSENEDGDTMFTQEKTVTTNDDGLLSTEIGDSGFEEIDWANGPYFLTCEIDPEGGTNYTITGTSQLISVPYAFYATTAETFSGDIEETDPVYSASVASGITTADTTRWNSKPDSLTETDPLFSEWVENGSVAQGDSIVLKDNSGTTRIVLNPNTGTFKMMDNDTVWYEIRVQSSPEEKVTHPDGSYTVNDHYHHWTTHAPDGRVLSETWGNADLDFNSQTIKYHENGQPAENEQIIKVEGQTSILKEKFSKDGHRKESHYTVEDDDPNGLITEEHKIYDASGNVTDEVIEERTKTGELVSRVVKKDGKIVSEENFYEETPENPVESYLRTWYASSSDVSWTKDDSYSSDGYSTTVQQGTNPPFGVQYTYQNNQSLITLFADNLKFNGKQTVNGPLGLNDGLKVIGPVNLYSAPDKPGNLTVEGNITAEGTKNFKINHPLEPGKYLQHASIESNEVLNQYSGNIVTDNAGKAIVSLPDYFEAINTDYRYQLTVIGTFAQAVVSKEIGNNQFEIQTNKPNIKVSWQVTAKRNDVYMQENPYKDETDK